MKDRIIKVSKYKNKRELERNNNKFSECSNEVKFELIKEKLYDELEQYYSETMKVVDRLENEFAIFKDGTERIKNGRTEKLIVYSHGQVFVEELTKGNSLDDFVNDGDKGRFRTWMFKKMEEHYFNDK
ncbi:MAG: hypothetical protein Q4F66_03335 [Clostridium sp.]|nr:hypothetical protein [Clostridium sp.]